MGCASRGGDEDEDEGETGEPHIVPVCPPEIQVCQR